MFFTAKKRLYVEARLSGKNQQDSAVAAGYAAAYAKQAGYRLERDPDVQLAFARYKAQGKIDLPKDPPPKSEAVSKTPSKTKQKAVKPPELPDDSAKLPDWASMLAPSPNKKPAKNMEKKTPKTAPPAIETDDPLEFMRLMMKDAEEDPRLRLEAAKQLAMFTVSKPGEKGKKEVQVDAAKEVAKKFRSVAPPVMKLVKK